MTLPSGSTGYVVAVSDTLPWDYYSPSDFFLTNTNVSISGQITNPWTATALEISSGASYWVSETSSVPSAYLGRRS